MPGWKRSICTFPQEVLWKTALEEAASWNLRVPGAFWPSCSFLNRLFLVSGVLLEKSVDALCAPLRVCDTATLASWCHGVVHEHVQVRESLGKTSTSICSDVTALLSTVYFVLYRKCEAGTNQKSGGRTMQTACGVLLLYPLLVSSPSTVCICNTLTQIIWFMHDTTNHFRFTMASCILF